MDMSKILAMQGEGDFPRGPVLEELRPADYRAQDGWEAACDNLDQFMRSVFAERRGIRLVLDPQTLIPRRDPFMPYNYRIGTARALSVANEIEIHLGTGERIVAKSRNGWTGYVIDLNG